MGMEAQDVKGLALSRLSEITCRSRFLPEGTFSQEESRVIGDNVPLPLIKHNFEMARTSASATGYAAGALVGLLPGPMLWRRDREAGTDGAEDVGVKHLAFPCLASIIRFTRSVRSALLMTQQITASRSTARKTTAASAGMPSRTRATAGGIPATT
jgi:hypothetical protein